VTKQGVIAIVATRGNDRCHVILRGGNSGPNFSPEHVAQAAEQLIGAKQPGRVMIDASHGNSSKNHRNQPKVAHAIAEQIRAGDTRVFGLMIESHLVEGRQDYKAGQATYGQSITDACIGWDDTVPVLEDLASAVRARRAARKG
jgi:3-deoxy-7-phosphoheptulonate synthase